MTPLIDVVQDRSAVVLAGRLLIGRARNAAGCPLIDRSVTRANRLAGGHDSFPGRMVKLRADGRGLVVGWRS